MLLLQTRSIKKSSESQRGDQILLWVGCEDLMVPLHSVLLPASTVNKSTMVKGDDHKKKNGEDSETLGERLSTKPSRCCI